MKIFTLLLAFGLLFVSCKPSLSVKAGNSDEATILFSTGFSQSTAKTLKNLSGIDEKAAIFNKEDILTLLLSAGATNPSATLPTPTDITASGTINELSKNQLSLTGLITKSADSITLTIGPRQIVDFYTLLNDDAKSYLDLMMIPALIGEKMSFQEYQDLLSSMYGPTFADEIVNGKLSINLSSPDGKKKLKDEISLGELLTAEKQKVWSLKY